GIQNLSCQGTAVPTVDWQTYITNPDAIPVTCADGSQGTVFANTSPNVSLFAKGYTPQASWRTQVGFGGPIFKNAYRFSLNGTVSLNQNQQGTIDLNFNDQNPGAFTLSNEGGRPVFVAPSSIVANSGSIGSKASRK